MLPLGGHAREAGLDHLCGSECKFHRGGWRCGATRHGLQIGAILKRIPHSQRRCPLAGPLLNDVSGRMLGELAAISEPVVILYAPESLSANLQVHGALIINGSPSP
jgi:hypothetical protein